MTFLKWFGWGILWALLLPFLLVAIALVAVLGVPIFFVELVIMIVHFFRGEKCFPLFEEGPGPDSAKPRCPKSQGSRRNRAEKPERLRSAELLHEPPSTDSARPPWNPGCIPNALSPRHSSAAPLSSGNPGTTLLWTAWSIASCRKPRPNSRPQPDKGRRRGAPKAETQPIPCRG